ncbi:HPP family protein [Salarchaeum sp. III]|uniref:HPP family protein n=1 Tax=Salarchaeum sp. III TaxID=3107927 RepID=UPI002EDBA5C0
MNRQRLVAGLHAGGLFAVLGVIAWAAGTPFVFPSLGPSAFVLAFGDRIDRTRRTVVGAHAVGAAAGLLSYLAFGDGATVTASFAAFSVTGAQLAASGTLSVVLTAWGMFAVDAVHPPACATTLIVSLGLLATPVEAVVIVVSVAVLVETHRLLAPVTLAAD